MQRRTIKQCGICSLFTGLMRRAMCVTSRRGSGESYYRELGDQDTLRIEDKSSDLSQDSDEHHEVHQYIVKNLEDVRRRIDFSAELSNMTKKNLCTGRFLTMHKRRRKRLLTRSLYHETALLDDIYPGQVQYILDQSVQWKFNAFTLETVTGGRCLPVLCVHLFQCYGLISHFKLDVAKAWKLFSLIEEGYHSTNPYHNSVHAADVTQAMHCFLQQSLIREHIEPLEIMASLLAAVAHDMDHPGVNQPFLVATSNHLASLYRNTSVLENHHWRSAISCLIESGLLDQMQDLRVSLEKQIASLILATDITRQQEYLSQFKVWSDFKNNTKKKAAKLHRAASGTGGGPAVHARLTDLESRVLSIIGMQAATGMSSVEEAGLFLMHLDAKTLDMKKAEHRHLVLQIALKCADISNPCRSWEISRKWSLKVCEEFFRQGDYERKLNLPVTALCDRHTTSIPKIQTGFFKFVVTPLMTEWHNFLNNDLSKQMLKNLRYNQGQWEMLLAREVAEETKTEISDADLVDDDLETGSGTNISDSSEMLLPLRRGSLNPDKQEGLKDQLRRFSVPLNVFQDTKFKNRENKLDISLQDGGDNAHALGSEHSIHSQLSVRGQCDHIHSPNEKVLSTEKLLPDSSIASITTPVQATRLNTVLKNSGTWKLVRQQTFPPLEASSRAHHLAFKPIYTSNEDAIFATTYDNNRFSNLFLNTDDKTDNDDASEKSNVDVTNARKLEKNKEPARVAGSQLRDNLTSIQLEPFVTEQQLLHRRKSDTGTHTPRERKVRDVSAIPELLRTLTQRRGSAPVPIAPSEVRGLTALSALRHSINGGRRKPSPVVPFIPQLPRRSSLPVEGSHPTSEEVMKTSESK